MKKSLEILRIEKKINFGSELENSFYYTFRTSTMSPDSKSRAEIFKFLSRMSPSISKAKFEESTHPDREKTAERFSSWVQESFTISLRPTPR